MGVWWFHEVGLPNRAGKCSPAGQVRAGTPTEEPAGGSTQDPGVSNSWDVMGIYIW